ncbi:MAG: hypothetical protein LQ347_003171 [Umbilicaria vellea]|nr:MAG: hypothetical protein LQ347_003171 [Umbilicaria vellea]
MKVWVYVAATEPVSSIIFFFTKARPATLLMLNIDASGLHSVSNGGDILVFLSLTSFPAWTHLLHGRRVSQAKCFLLQLTHAEGTCAFALLAVLEDSDVDCGGIGESCRRGEHSSLEQSAGGGVATPSVTGVLGCFTFVSGTLCPPSVGDLLSCCDCTLPSVARRPLPELR